MAHKKAGGSSRNGRDSNPKMLGVKRYGGQKVHSGEILSPTWDAVSSWPRWVWVVTSPSTHWSTAS